MIRIEFLEMVQIADALDTLRQNFPAAARTFDKCLFEILDNHTPKCGHASCGCMQMTFEIFHGERNIKFRRSGEEKL